MTRITPGGDKMRVCACWQEFLEIVVNWISHGYRDYCIITYPEEKRDRWQRTDDKLNKKYGLNAPRHFRYRNKKAKKASYAGVRWDMYALILRTPGDACQAEDDRFHALDKVSYLLSVGDTLVLRIGPRGPRGQKCGVYIEKQCVRNIRAELLEDISHRRVDLVISGFDRLNGIPAYSGVTKQKADLLTDILKAAKSRKLRLKRSDFRFITRRLIYTKKAPSA